MTRLGLRALWRGTGDQEAASSRRPQEPGHEGGLRLRTCPGMLAEGATIVCSIFCRGAERSHVRQRLRVHLTLFRVSATANRGVRYFGASTPRIYALPARPSVDVDVDAIFLFFQRCFFTTNRGVIVCNYLVLQRR